jgi:hypothetical protein
MGRLFIPAERKIKGPWILQQNDLERLELVLNNIFEKLKSALAEDIEKNSEKYKYTKPKLNSSVVLVSKNKTQIIDKSILGILKDQKLNDLQPNELTIELGKRYSGFAFLMTISANYDGALEYSVECQNEEIKDEIKYEVDKWLEECAPNKISQYWTNSLSFITIPLFIGLIFILLTLLFVSAESNYKNELNSKAQTIIKNGVNENNQFETLEIILKLQTDFKPESQIDKTTIRPEVLKILIITILCFILLEIKPRTTIGVGKSKRKAIFYRFWQKSILVTIPTTIILPKLFDLIFN